MAGKGSLETGTTSPEGEIHSPSPQLFANLLRENGYKMVSQEYLFITGTKQTDSPKGKHLVMRTYEHGESRYKTEMVMEDEAVLVRPKSRTDKNGILQDTLDFYSPSFLYALEKDWLQLPPES